METPRTIEDKERLVPELLRTAEGLKSLKLRHIWAMPTTGKSLFCAYYPNVIDSDYASKHPQYFGAGEKLIGRKAKNDVLSRLAIEYEAVGLAAITNHLLSKKWLLPDALSKRCYNSLDYVPIKDPSAGAKGTTSLKAVPAVSSTRFTPEAQQLCAVSNNWNMGYTINLSIAGADEPKVYVYRQSADQIVGIGKLRGDNIPLEVALSWTRAATRWGTQAFDIMIDLNFAYVSEVFAVVDGHIRLLPDVALELVEIVFSKKNKYTIMYKVTESVNLLDYRKLNYVELNQGWKFWDNVLTIGIEDANSISRTIPVGRRLPEIHIPV
jgi:hypothetical protein